MPKETIISFTPGKREAEALAKTRANRDGRPYGVWEHVGLYGSREGDIPSRHTFRVLDLAKPDPTPDWALVSCIDPDGV